MTVGLFLDGVAPRRRAAALFDQIRGGIVAGRLRPGDRLPPSRDLAAELGVARSTITTVYARLVAEGHAEGRPGDGTYVARLPTPRPRGRRFAPAGPGSALGSSFGSAPGSALALSRLGLRRPRPVAGGPTSAPVGPIPRCSPWPTGAAA